ncbi:MAG: YfaZ family outer membrane protein [Ectothiorhodospiraceae bacterium]|jgi:hypothetical protein
MKFRLLGLVLLLGCTAASATELELNLSNDAARASVVQPIDPQGLEVGGGFLHHVDNGDILDAGLHLVDIADPGRGALDVGLGAKVYAVSFDDSDADGGALAVGGKFRYTWPTFNRFGIGGHLYYAPRVTSGGDIDRYVEGAIRAEYLIIKNANAYIGFRRIEVGNKKTDNTETFDTGLNAGIRLEF